jgi:hypothetical protein
MDKLFYKNAGKRIPNLLRKLTSSGTEHINVSDGKTDLIHVTRRGHDYGDGDGGEEGSEFYIRHIYLFVNERLHVNIRCSIALYEVEDLYDADWIKARIDHTLAEGAAQPSVNAPVTTRKSCISKTY